MKISQGILLSLCMVTVLATAAHAQKVDDLVEGVRVRIAAPGRRPVDGTFQSASPDSIKIISDGVHVVFPRNDSIAVFKSAGIHRARSAAVVGTAAGILGAVAGAAIGAASWKPCDSRGFYDCAYVPTSKARATVFGGAVFGVSSAAIGALVGAGSAGHTWLPVER